MSTSPLELLHVEDNFDDVILLRRAMLKCSMPLNVHVVRDGSECIAYLDGNGPFDNRTLYPLPDLLLVDLKLPRVSGHDVLRWARGNAVFKYLPIVILSSSSELDDVQLAYGLGANSYLTKPSSPEELQTLVTRLQEYWFGLNVFVDLSNTVSGTSVPGLEHGARK